MDVEFDPWCDHRRYALTIPFLVIRYSKVIKNDLRVGYHASHVISPLQIGDHQTIGTRRSK